MNRGPGVSLIIKRREVTRGDGSPKEKQKSADTLLGTCLACISRRLSRLPAPFLFFSLSLFLFLNYFSSRRSWCSPSLRCIPRLAYPPISFFSSDSAKCGVPSLQRSFRPSASGSQGLKPAKLRNRVTQRHPLPLRKHTTRVHAQNITQAIKKKGRRGSGHRLCLVKGETTLIS